VDHIVNVGVVVKDLVESSLVADVGLVELGSLAADELNAVDDFLGGVVETVDDDDLVVGFEEGQSGKGANVACATVELSTSCEAWRGRSVYPATRTEPTTILSRRDVEFETNEICGARV
jgi:hypothetical protein